LLVPLRYVKGTQRKRGEIVKENPGKMYAGRKKKEASYQTKRGGGERFSGA